MSDVKLTSSWMAGNLVSAAVCFAALLFAKGRTDVIFLASGVAANVAYVAGVIVSRMAFRATLKESQS